MLTVSNIPALKDNYIWVIKDQKNKCFIVDPGDEIPVLNFIKNENLELEGILLTHHHHDHTDGVEALTKAFPELTVFGPNTERFPWVTHPLKHLDNIMILECEFSVYEVPGHTVDHIVYFNNTMLFCGDTLFSGGCGRIFEGTHEQMHNSLNLIANLPDNTDVFCAHEYTQANLKFAQIVEPNNLTLREYVAQLVTDEKVNFCSLPTTIAREKAINPFLRTSEPSVKAAVHMLANGSDLETFAALRDWKDRF